MQLFFCLKQHPEPKLITSVRCGTVSLRVVLATEALVTTVLYDLRIKIHLIVSRELCSMLFPALLSHLSICYTVEMYLPSELEFRLHEVKQLESYRQILSSGYFFNSRLCGG